MNQLDVDLADLLEENNRQRYLIRRQAAVSSEPVSPRTRAHSSLHDEGFTGSDLIATTLPLLAIGVAVVAIWIGLMWWLNSLVTR